MSITSRTRSVKPENRCPTDSNIIPDGTIISSTLPESRNSTESRCNDPVWTTGHRRISTPSPTCCGRACLAFDPGPGSDCQSLISSVKHADENSLGITSLNTRKPSLLVLGATGLLGQAIVAEAKRRGIPVLGAARKGSDFDVDLTNVAQVAELFARVSPTRVINAA